MTSLGGANGYGAIFRMTPAGPITVIKQLDNSTGGGPRGTLIQGTDGNLYGMTNYGGTSNGGTIFKITLTGTLTVPKKSHYHNRICANGQFITKHRW